MPKTRTKNARFPWSWHYREGAAPSWSNEATYSGTKTLQRSHTGTGLPKYRQIIAEHGNATTVASGVWKSLEATRMTFKVSVKHPYSGSPYDVECEDFPHVDYFVDPVWPSEWTSNADSRAASKFLRKVREAQVQMSGPTFLGELRETLRMLHRPASGLQDLIKRYLGDVAKQKRRRQRGANAWISSLSDLWLEYAFGWSPLMMDIDEAINAYNSLFDKERIIAVTGSARDFMKGAYEVDDMAPPYVGIPCWTDHRTTMYHEVVRYRGAVRAQAATTAAERFARFGFTPDEFIPTAWELLPWSFLLDYFANVGDILEAAVTSQASLVWKAKSTIQFMDKQVQQTKRKQTFWIETASTWSPGTLKYKAKSFVRTPLTGYIFPSFYMTVPTSLKKLTNIVALIGVANRDIHPQTPRPVRRWRN